MRSSRAALVWTALLTVAACWAGRVCAVEPGTLLAIHPDPSNPAASNYNFTVVGAVTVAATAPYMWLTSRWLTTAASVG